MLVAKRRFGGERDDEDADRLVGEDVEHVLDRAAGRRLAVEVSVRADRPACPVPRAGDVHHAERVGDLGRRAPAPAGQPVAQHGSRWPGPALADEQLPMVPREALWR